MSETTIKPKKFDLWEILRASEALTNSYVLKALGEMLGTSEIIDSDDCKCGISNMIDLYLEWQEKVLSELWAKVKNDPDWIIQKAKDDFSRLNNCHYMTIEEKLKEISQIILNLEAVILTFGNKYPEASLVKQDFMRLQEAIISQSKEKEEI